MSSTVRGSKKRNKDDFYVTPEWCTAAILPYLPARPHYILDAGAGSGSITEVIELYYTNVCKKLYAVEIDEGRSRELKDKHICTNVQTCDFIEDFDMVGFDLVIMNPPYKLAIEFIRKSISISKMVVALLRLNFLGSRKRRDFHRKNPSDVHVLVPRPSFMSDGGSDSCEYAWFIWGPGKRGKINVL